MQPSKLSVLQLDLLKVYSFQPSEEDLLAIRQLLANYFSAKLISKVQESVDEKGITEATLDQWLNE
ncbi:hypothetical protein [Fibrella aquatilis]|uniref:Uncharacterized protein n=1 Tax=Fibrella aquatilis TaxID=2817059 RepID=A0A939JZE9_9BACT|nr:hypothetical protein [Fibrella aquatilis]MBO0930866.1 hypothetical protein [Fibrella aquatilis]